MIYINTGCLEHILLGRLFMINNEVQIDYKKESIRINDKFIYFDNIISRCQNTFDQDIYEKTCQRQLINTKYEISKLFNTDNKLLKTILNVEMLIKIKCSTPIARKFFQYPISYLKRKK